MSSFLVLIPVLVAILTAVFMLPKAMSKYKKSVREGKVTELEDIQKRILEAETSIVQMSADIRRMETYAEDHDSDAWQARRDRRWAAVNSDRTLLHRLEEREKQLKLELGIT